MSAIVTYDLTKKANKITFGTVVINRIDNPFDPIGSKVTRTDLHGLTLDKYLDGYCLGSEIIVFVNGKQITGDYSEYIVKPNDMITYTPIVQGGGRGVGKQILSIVAIVVLSYFAGPWGTAAGNAMFGAGTVAAGIAGSIVYGAIMIAGSLLIGHMLGQGTGAITDTIPQSESKTYSWNGIQTSRELNNPIPVLYGTHTLGGTVINSRFYYDGSSDWIGTQLALCHGEIQAITPDKIKVNDLAYSSYVKQGTTSNGRFQYRTGSFDQSIMTGYSDSIYNNAAVSQKINYNISWTFTSESTNINFFRLHFEFPYGLYNMDSQGTKSISTVKVRVNYRKVGTLTWQNMYNYDPRGTIEYGYRYRVRVGTFGLSLSPWLSLWSPSPNLTIEDAPEGAVSLQNMGNYRYNKNTTFIPTTDLTFVSKSSVPLKRY